MEGNSVETAVCTTLCFMIMSAIVKKSNCFYVHFKKLLALTVYALQPKN